MHQPVDLTESPRTNAIPQIHRTEVKNPYGRKSLVAQRQKIKPDIILLGAASQSFDKKDKKTRQRPISPTQEESDQSSKQVESIIQTSLFSQQKSTLKNFGLLHASQNKPAFQITEMKHQQIPVKKVTAKRQINDIFFGLDLSVSPSRQKGRVTLTSVKSPMRVTSPGVGDSPGNISASLDNDTAFVMGSVMSTVQ